MPSNPIKFTVFMSFADSLLYTPSKYPDYPQPHLITLNEKDKQLTCEFAKESGYKKLVLDTWKDSVSARISKFTHSFLKSKSS